MKRHKNTSSNTNVSRVNIHSENVLRPNKRRIHRSDSNLKRLPRGYDYYTNYGYEAEPNHSQSHIPSHSVNGHGSQNHEEARSRFEQDNDDEELEHISAMPHRVRGMNPNDYKNRYKITSSPPPGQDGYPNNSNNNDEENNPIQKNRHCRDVICLCFFMIGILTMLISIGYAYLYGDLHRISHFYTTSGGCGTCGRANLPIAGIPFSGNDLTEFPYGLVTISSSSSIKSPSPPSVSNTIIVEYSPQSSSSSSSSLSSLTSPLTDGTIITNLIILNSQSFTTSDCVKACPANTKAILYRCIPLDNSTLSSSTTSAFSSLQIIPQEIKDGISNNNNENDIFYKARKFFNELGLDFENSWQDIILMCLIGLGIAIVMTIFLRLFAGLIIWIIVLVISLTCIGGSITIWIIWYHSKIKFDDYTTDNNNSNVSNINANGASNNNNNYNGWSLSEIHGLLAGAIAASICTILLLLVFLIMRKRISLVISLFNEAGKAIHSMPLILLQPVITFATLTLALISWFLIALLIESSGIPVLKTIEDSDGNIKEHCYLEKNWFIIFSRWWNLFMIFWFNQFIIGCQHLIIAGSISTWFFTRNKSTLHFPILTSFHRLLRYHLGSIAFGSLIVAIVKLIRYILNWIQSRLQKQDSKLFGLCKGILCVCSCCLWCLEKCLIFLNRNAYIEIAIHGDGFCKSAKAAFNLIVNNALRLAAINSIGDFVLFLAKIGIVACTLAAGYQILKTREDLNHIWAPLIVAGICTFFIAHCFISVYEMAIDTIFICFCEDCKLNDGVSKPYFMNKGLMELVKNGKKKNTPNKP